MTAQKAMPRFKNEAQERAYWEANDSTPHLDWSKANKAVLPHLRPSTQTADEGVRAEGVDKNTAQDRPQASHQRSGG